jgi:hypothetical protein
LFSKKKKGLELSKNDEMFLETLSARIRSKYSKFLFTLGIVFVTSKHIHMLERRMIKRPL